MHEIDANDTRLAAEFKARPYGTHSPALQALLNLLRRGPHAGRYVIFCSKPGEEWMLARLSGVRGAPVEVLEDRVFHSEEEAEWAVFKLRWELHTGRKLEIE